VGQDHVREVLTAAIENDRIGHAYLFSGPRGVGKTTSARLLAMALNCDADPSTGRPCGTCESCTRIRAAEHPDVIELDAASNNSVEDVRELRERAQLASLGGGRRVWILDEAHMLSTAAANALLKTLEEPPEGLTFVLATTEPERLPPTVLSRCQHFRFRRLSETEIVSKLKRICSEANADAHDEALNLIARSADGAMRDAESMLERMMASGQTIDRPATEAALGLPPQERLERLAAALASDDLTAMSEEAADLYRDGFAPRSVAERLAVLLRDAALNAASGQDGFTVDLPRERLLAALHQFDDDLQRFTRQSDLYALELTLIKAANAAHARAPGAVQVQAGETRSATPATPQAAASKPQGRTQASVKQAPSPAAKQAAPAQAQEAPAQGAPAQAPEATAPERTTAPASAAAPEPASAPTPAPTPAQAPSNTPPPETQPPASSGFNRAALEQATPIRLRAFLKPATDTVEGRTLVLTFDPEFDFHRKKLEERMADLTAIVTQVAGSDWDVRIKRAGDEPPKKP
jgi:DNA polymerase-3 subunit gamma/tau